MLVTPFDEGGNVLWEHLDRLIECQLSDGVHGIAALGLLSESSHLSEKERGNVASRVLQRASVRVPVVIGVSAQDTRTVCRLARAAAEDGASALMVAPPATPGISRDQLRAHYLEVAAAAPDCPLMVQDAPSFLGVALGAEFIRHLTKACPSIRYVKSEAVPSGEKTEELIRVLGSRIRIFGGMGGLNCIEVLDAGAWGFIPGCELSRHWTALFEAYSSGRRQEAEAIYERVLPLVVFMYQSLDFGIACSKELLRHAGILSSAASRAPFLLGEWSRTVLAQHAERVAGP